MRKPLLSLAFTLAVLALASVPAYAADPLLDWIKSPEAYVATNAELDQWKRDVVTAADAQKFIDEFWRKRGEALRKEIRTRIEFADANFALQKTPGSRTAMGKVFILLKAPNEQKTDRTGQTGAGSTGFSGTMQDNSVERGARVTYKWVYKKDRLPQELGRAELVVEFETDTQRGSQHIGNPGVVEPYLRKVAEHLSAQGAATLAMTKPASPQVAKPAAPAAPDPLWSVTPNLNGAVFTGEAFISPRDTPFYAVSLYVPQAAATFKDWTSGLLVTLIRDETGTQVINERQPVEFAAYDDAGNRFIDRSYALAPGKYDAIVALYSPDGSTMLSSHREQFEVAAANAPRASKLFLTSRVETFEKQDALDPFTFVAQKMAVRGDRKFRTSDKIAFYTVIANPAGSPTPNLMQKMAFTKDGKPFFKSPLEHGQPIQTGPNTFLLEIAFDPGTFKPGHYALEYTVRDFNAPEGSEARTKGHVLTTEFDVN